jgi:hypothetical protein
MDKLFFESVALPVVISAIPPVPHIMVIPEVSDQPYKDTPLPQYGERTASHSHPSSSPAGDARQPYYYNHHHHHNPYTPSQYAPVQWDPYSYHHYQQIQHSQQSWNSSTPQYHSNDDSPNNETAPNRFSHYTTKDGRPQDFLRQAAPPSYPYYFPSYPVYYPQHGSDYAKMPAQNTLYPAPDGMSTQPQDIPAQRTMSLYMACDEDRLSEYQCLARKQIEVFSATYSDLKMTVQGRNRQVLPGQVGIRCRFCSHIPVKKQARASVYYPSKLDCIYQAAQNMASVHLAKYCSFVPEDIRNELQRHMKDRKSSAGGGKEYWAVSARSLGIEECDGRLRFATPITDDSSRAT